MIIMDKLLSERQRTEKPIRVAMVGAGFVGKGLARQITKYVEGMELVAISNRAVSGAERAYQEAGISNMVFVENADPYLRHFFSLRYR